MKEHLTRRLEMDRRRMEQYLGRDIPKEMEELIRNTTDPTVRVVSMSKQYPLMDMRIRLVQVALRIFRAHEVGAKRALELAWACGHDGAVAYRMEDYEAISIEMCGEKARFWDGDEKLMAQMRSRSGGKLVAAAGTELDVDRKYNDCVITLRAALWALDAFDIPPETAEHLMAVFQWSNIWQDKTPPGRVAMAIEDYARRVTTRREMTRH